MYPLLSYVNANNPELGLVQINTSRIPELIFFSTSTKLNCTQDTIASFRDIFGRQRAPKFYLFGLCLEPKWMKGVAPYNPVLYQCLRLRSDFNLIDRHNTTFLRTVINGSLSVVDLIDQKHCFNATEQISRSCGIGFMGRFCEVQIPPKPCQGGYPLQNVCICYDVYVGKRCRKFDYEK